MSATTIFRFLRPYLSSDLPAARKSAYLRFFSNTRCLGKLPTKRWPRTSSDNFTDTYIAFSPLNSNIRKEKLEAMGALKWDRIKSNSLVISNADFNKKYKHLREGQTLDPAVAIQGRIHAVRIAGQKLLFIDVVDDGNLVQLKCNYEALGSFSDIDKRDWNKFRALVRGSGPGDFISALGIPHRTQGSKGELSLICLDIPTILAPALHVLPTILEDPETRIRNRHLDMLVNREVTDTLKARSYIIQFIRNFLLKDKFLEVQTPIISDVTGGAVAKPFTTTATEFPEKQLALRIAPELWLKRLVIGGLARVFEIGPAFRNEGVDSTHNPEFTTCEFYKSYANLEDLMEMTEKMITGIAQHITELRQETILRDMSKIDADLFATPFKRIEFIPAIEKALDEKLPDLSSDKATEELIAIFEKHSLSIPQSPTLPRLLDKLASIYIEPSCTTPTFIIYHPSCMSPLSKSFLCPQTSQLISARAELFIQNRELCNMYEEENSPIEQRQKFIQQAKYRDEENDAKVDESYLEALEWGLPPTGGWGCGIDRLVMLFSAANRISDVLAFGNLRNVVNLSSPAPRTTMKGK